MQITQMKFRLSEGNGECFYYIGECTAGARRSSCWPARVPGAAWAYMLHPLLLTLVCAYTSSPVVKCTPDVPSSPLDRCTQMYSCPPPPPCPPPLVRTPCDAPGVEDDGYPRGLDPKELQGSIGVVTTMASSLSATARVVELLPGAYGRQAAILHIRCKEEEDMDYQDLRVVGEWLMVGVTQGRRLCAGQGAHRGRWEYAAPQQRPVLGG